GGGVGAVVAAFELTDPPDWKDRYEVTVYQMGWRLGGKGASGRNHARCERIEEHGLHIWMGFYENAFRLMRKCYQEVGRQPGEPRAAWTDAFGKQTQVTLMEAVDGRWVPWLLDFPDNDAVPGDGGVFLEPWDYVRMLLRWLVRKHEQSGLHADPAPTVVVASWVEQVWRDTVVRVQTAAGAVVETVATVTGAVGGAAAAVLQPLGGSPSGLLLHRAHDLAEQLPADPRRHSALEQHALVVLLDEFIGRRLRAVEA